MKKILLISLIIFAIVSVLFAIYTIEISSAFTEFEGEDDEIEDEGIQKTSEISQDGIYQDFTDNPNPQLKFSHNPVLYCRIIKFNII